MERKKISLDLVPFTRIIWKSKEAKAEWEPKLRKASNVYHVSEWKMVAKQKRKCGTIHFNKNNWEQMLDRLVDDGLFFKPIARTANYSGFSHKHLTPKPNEDYNVYGVLASSKDDALEFAKASQQNTDHNKIGDLLGYPKCCQNAFVNRWSNEIIDPMFEAAMATNDMEFHTGGDAHIVKLKEVPIETNQLLRYFGIRTTSHLPCRFDCEDTIQMAGDWKKIMKQTDKQAFGYLKELLEMPLRWDSYHGIVIITNDVFRGITTSGFNKKRIIKVGNVSW